MRASTRLDTGYNDGLLRMLGGGQEVCVPLRVVWPDRDDASLLVMHIIALKFVQGHSNGSIHFVISLCHLLVI